jgi:hypothetical protein
MFNFHFFLPFYSDRLTGQNSIAICAYSQESLSCVTTVLVVCVQNAWSSRKSRLDRKSPLCAYRVMRKFSERLNRILLVFLLFSSSSTDRNVFKGFYTISGQSSTTNSTRNRQSFNPCHSSPLEVTGSYHWTSHSQLSTEHLLVLHFILDGISPIGSSCRILVEYMKAFLLASRLFFEEIVFDFSQTVLNDSLEQKLRILSQSFR